VSTSSSDLLTPSELAEYLKVPVKTIYNWRSGGTGPRGIRVGRHVRFRRTEIEAWLDRQVEGGVFG
jgi:excisionase family DNA binding protein